MAWRRGEDATDQGMVTAFVIVFAMALVFVSGLVVDGGRMLAEHREVNNLADSAARAGAQAVSDDAVRRGDRANLLDEAEAIGLACALLAQADHPCGGGTSVAVQGNEVVVTVSGSIDLLLLAGADRPVRGEGTACVAVGMTDGTC
jgi:Flp pilus assembly protein TadG